MRKILKLKIVIILLALLLLLIVSLLWWAFSPLLFDVEVQDELSPTLKAKLEANKNVNESSLPGEPVNVNEENTVNDTGVISRGPFPIISTPGHPATGNVEIIKSPEETVVQYVNYEGTNGPDLYIYLAKDLEATDYVELGRQRGNKGNIIYQVPDSIDISEYKYILTWCKAFGVLFDYIEIK